MLTKLLTNIFHSSFSGILIFLLISGVSYAQIDSSATKTTIVSNDSIVFNTDTLNPPSKKKSDFTLEEVIKYNAEDTIITDWDTQKAYLYGNAVVEYGVIILKAGYIEIDLKNNSIYACGITDSTGKVIGIPVFKDGDDEYQTASLNYNFNTKKGLVSKVTKQEGDAYVYISEGKRMADNTLFVQSGHFTTCSAEHPHFRIRYNKGKIIPNDKIVTGPIYLEFQDVPLPLFLPFGFFPNKKGRANGILIPSYGYTENRGYRLSGGGYYWGLGPHADLSLRGEIYSRGSWGLATSSRYRKMYKYSGNLNLTFNSNKFGDPQSPQFYKENTFNINWQHSQDLKSNPYSTFSASVNFGSSKHNRYNSNSIQERLNNSYSSSIAYSARLWQKYNLVVNLGHSQNNLTRQVSINAPSLSFSTPRYKPFEKTKRIGKKKWYNSFYENIQLGYTMNAQNQINTYDSLLLKSKFSDFKNGIKHDVPISTNVNLGFVTWNTNMSISERWYFQTISQNYVFDTLFNDTDTILPGLKTAQNSGFFSAHDYNLSTSFNTRIYGMFIFKRGAIKALRHVLTPNLSLSYHPDFGSKTYGYYSSYIGPTGIPIIYSKFDGAVYGSPPYGKFGGVQFSIDNNFELKVKSKKDTITGTKKIVLIESARFSTSYNFAVEKFKLAPMTLYMRTTLFKQVAVNFNGSWDFYDVDSVGTKINVFYIKSQKKLLRAESFLYSFNMTYNLNADKFKKKNNTPAPKTTSGTKDELEYISTHKDDYVDFNIPWTLNVGLDYSRGFRYNFKEKKFDIQTSQTFGVSGDINITKKWKVGFTTGYDFRQKALSSTSLDIYRDLHCWELLFNWIPFGDYKSYNLTIRVKSAILQDLKYNKKKGWQDY